MKLKKLGILAVAGILLAVMTSNVALATSYSYNYDNKLWSYIASMGDQADNAWSEWHPDYGSDGEHLDVYKNVADHVFVVSTNQFTNLAPDVGYVNVLWSRSAYNSNWNSCLTPTADGTYYPFTVTYGQTSQEQDGAGIAEIDKSAASGEYSNDNGHTYYPSVWPFSYNAYSSNPMARKIIDLH